MITTRIILTIYYNDDDVNGYHMMTRTINTILCKSFANAFRQNSWLFYKLWS